MGVGVGAVVEAVVPRVHEPTFEPIINRLGERRGPYSEELSTVVKCRAADSACGKTPAG